MLTKKRIKNKKTVFVGLSGGVDSALSAFLLKEQGYEVVGVFIRTWHPDFLVCNEEEERKDAMRVAAHLDIPFLTFDFEEVYKKEVADYMIDEYKKGRTPNPDVMCNQAVKFGAFFQKALSMGADFVATGHYAQKKLEILEKKYYLLRSKDPTKDQVYFLWTLKQEQLSKILFPIGHLKKTQVRTLAKKFKLPIFEKKDSQGICFLGDVDLKDFLKHYIQEKKGKVLNEQGVEIGYHTGVTFYTLGERRGFVISKKSPNDKPYYIVAKDFLKNTLIVSQNKDFFIHNLHVSGKEKDFVLFLKNPNWISGLPALNKKYTMQIRYHGEFISCKIISLNTEEVKILLEKPVLVASGQSVVLYDKDIVLGGGVVF